MQTAERSVQSKRLTSNRRLNVWWFCQYASTPDQQLTTQHDLARRLVEKGHQITFFAAGFSHYKFKEIRLKPGERWRIDQHDGVRFVWIKTTPYHANDWKRVVNMCSYAWRAYGLARSWKETPDVIIGTTFHPLASLSAYALSVSKHRPFIFEVRDLWPLTMIQFGRLSPKSPIAVAMYAMEKYLARRATKIVTTLPGGANYYSGLGVPKDRIVWIPNGLELSRYKDLQSYTGEISESYVLLYAGGHVYANALETVLRAARIQQENGNRARFVFVGGGQEKPRLMHMAKDLDLRNIEFRDAVPKSQLGQVMEEADAFILSMRDLPELYQYGISFNKLCDYVASGRPVIFAGDPSNNVVEEFRCGIVVPPEDPQAFAEAIRRFENMMPEERAEMGRNAIRCAKERFDITMLADRLEAILLSVAEEFNSRPRPLEDHNAMIHYT
jgi:glycosyltransferase involved in cell wall biosynthesis